jgi:hypothetical protein
MYDSAILGWIPQDYSLAVYGALIGLSIEEAVKKAKNFHRNRKQVVDLWENRFPSFMKEDSQNVVGGKIGGDISQHPVPSQYMLNAARRSIIPNNIRILSSIYKNKKLHIEPTDDTKVDNHKNIILYGGCETSELCKALLANRKLNFVHALLVKEKTGEDYIKEEIKDDDILKIREERTRAFQESRMAGAAGKWVIINRSKEKAEERVEHKPDQYHNGTYFEDSVIITYYKNPQYGKRDILAISGTREIGTYLGDLYLKEPKLVSELQKGFMLKHIKPGDYFQVIIRFEMKQYKPGVLIKKNMINNTEILNINKID